MLIIEYDPGVTGEFEEVKTPARNVQRIGKSKYWYLLKGDRSTTLRPGARILTAIEARTVLRRIRSLPSDHPLFGSDVLPGPFPSGTLAGDIRLRLDGGYDIRREDAWEAWRSSDGTPVPEISAVETSTVSPLVHG